MRSRNGGERTDGREVRHEEEAEATTVPLVVGIDGSQASLEAVDWAADEAARHDVPLRLLHAAAAGHDASDLVAAASESRQECFCGEAVE
ncbi:universal stress protein [Streptomyces sp. NBC_00019]|uniref:universal stress protein n=1 Tax=Streptomyces sp. NBC_00019 TaxID=2975623 RepID=UPI003870120D